MVTLLKTNGIVSFMKTLLKVALLALFAAVVFMPTRGMAPWLYWTLFVTMFLILALYYLVTYWVGKKAIADKNQYSLFVGMVPAMSSEDLVRGRLVVEDERLILYQKGAKEVWSAPISSIESFTLEKVVGLRKGFSLTLENDRVVSFTKLFMKQRKEKFIEALGWSDASIN